MGWPQGLHTDQATESVLRELLFCTGYTVYSPATASRITDCHSGLNTPLVDQPSLTPVCLLPVVLSLPQSVQPRR